MEKPFDSFSAELNWQQVHLLLDTVLYFEEAPKLLSIPNLEGERIPVPITAETLRELVQAMNESEPFEKQRVTFSFDWTDEAASTGTLLVTLPSGKEVRQQAVLTQFSPV